MSFPNLPRRNVTTSLCLERVKDGQAYYGWVEHLEFPHATLCVTKGLCSTPGERFLLTLRKGTSKERYYAILKQSEDALVTSQGEAVTYGFDAPRHHFELEEFALNHPTDTPSGITLLLKKQSQGSEEFSVLECSRTSLIALCPYPLSIGRRTLVELRKNFEPSLLCQAEIDECSKIPELDELYRVGFRLQTIEAADMARWVVWIATQAQAA